MASVIYFLLALVAIASAAPESRIVGGTETTIEQFPAAISILYFYPGAGITVQRCVGGLISSWHVLTSGFCFFGANLDNMQARAGSTSSTSGGTVVNVRKFERHPDYVQSPRASDIAVLFLNQPLGISNTVNVLYLPPVNTYIPDDASLKVVSWGFLTPDGPQLDSLKSIDLNKLNVEECKARYGDSSSVAISENVICAQAPGKGTCVGDSGAPMVINNVIVGTSSHFQSCDDEYPSVFARVDKYTNWILEVAAAGRSGERLMSAPVVV